MATYTDLNKNIRLVHDLVWLQAADSDRLSIMEAAGDARQIVQVANSYDSIMVGQYLPGPLDGSQRGKTLVSFAAWMAAYLKDERQALVCVETAPGKAAMVGLVNGLPVPDSDRSGSQVDITSLATEFLSDYPEAVLYGDVQGFEADRLKPLDLDGLHRDKNATKLLRPARIRSLSAGASTLIRAMVFLGLLAVVGYLGYDYYKTNIKPPPAVQAQKEKPPEQIYAEGLAAAIKQEGITVAAARQVIKAARAENLLRPGWRMSRLKCVGSSCSALWVRSADTASFADLVQALGGEKLQLQIDQSALQTLTFPASTEDRDYPDPLSLPRRQDTWVNLLSPLQRTAGRVQFGLNQGAAFPVQGLTPPNSIYKTQLSVSGPVWADAYFGDLPSWVMIREFAYEMPEEQQLEGVKIDANLIFFTKD